MPPATWTHLLPPSLSSLPPPATWLHLLPHSLSSLTPPSLSSMGHAPEPDQHPPGPLLTFGSTLTSCAICLADYVPGASLRLLDRCGHIFHRRCIDDWLSHAAVCPVCKARAAPPPDRPPRIPGLPAHPPPAPAAHTANVQLIDTSVGQSWTDWFHQLLAKPPRPPETPPNQPANSRPPP